jgi:CNT family concentrative nucleoside transporter
VSASVLSIPCAVLAAKLVLPETEVPETAGEVPPMAHGERHSGVMGALSAGAWDGLMIAAGIATILIAVLGVVGILDALLTKVAGSILAIDEPLTIAGILGWAFTPLAWLLGIEPSNVGDAARLLGQRVILTEVVSYQEFGVLAKAGRLSPRTILVLSYALCGFAHVGGMGIAVAGFGALAPDRREDMAALAFRALAVATLATLLTGALAGMFYHGQRGVLGL